jgi:hypothetical protein
VVGTVTVCVVVLVTVAIVAAWVTVRSTISRPLEPTKYPPIPKITAEAAPIPRREIKLRLLVFSAIPIALGKKDKG